MLERIGRHKDENKTSLVYPNRIHKVGTYKEKRYGKF